MSSAQQESIADPESFWLPKAKQLITWSKPPSRAVQINRQNSPPDLWQWFPDGQLNICYNAVDRHPKQDVALYYDSPVTGTKQRVTYGELLHRVQGTAGMLRDVGVKKGHTVVVYMPMIPQAVETMLACTRIGAVLCVVFGGFAPPEMQKRIDDAKPDVIVTSSCGIEAKRVVPYKPLVTEAVKLSKHKPKHLIILRRKQVNVELDGSSGMKEYDYEEYCRRIHDSKKAMTECVSVKSSDPFFLLYTSGTTGKPKGVLRESGGDAVAKAFTMEYLFGLKRGDTICTFSDIGWIVGLAYSVFAPLIAGVSTVLYEGKPIGTPDGGAFWRVCHDYKVNVMFCAPTALRAIRREDPQGEQLANRNLKQLRAIFLAGERSEPGIVEFYQSLIGKYGAPGALVIDNYWSTESGSPITSVALGAKENFKPRAGTAGPPMPGMNVCIVDDEGKELPRGKEGNIVMKTPLAPSAFTTLWNNPEGFYDSYFKRFNGKYFDTADSGFISKEDGFLNVLSRTDDIINVAAHRLSTGSIEQVLASHSGVAEACVVGMPDEAKGQLPLAFVVSSSGANESHKDLYQSLNQEIRKQIGGIASLGGVVILPTGSMPKTRSGKTLRRLLRTLAEQASQGDYDKDVPIPATIEDPNSVQSSRTAINKFFRSKGEHQRSAKASKL